MSVHPSQFLSEGNVYISSKYFMLCWKGVRVSLSGCKYYFSCERVFICAAGKKSIFYPIVHLKVNNDIVQLVMVVFSF